MTPSHLASAPVSADEEYALPGVEALLAGTLALMTGHAQACCDGHRDAMARKIAAQLGWIGELQGFTPHFRTVLGTLRARWLQQAGLPDDAGAHAQAAALSAAEQHRALWLRAPEVLQ
ncbi:hypothetical protein [Acidovorax lacteus]|uniref:Uncharacterized protein n=1 Tax=Acidovorax lacteus TaxID=1924988 RepID=A0ABP8LJ05_9BURK